MKITSIETSVLSTAVASTFPPYQDYVSESKIATPPSAGGSDFESLLPVQLSGPLANEYSNVFFTTKTLKSVRRSEEKTAERNQRKAAMLDGGVEVPDDENEDNKVVQLGGPAQVLRETYAMFAEYLTRQSGFVNAGFTQSRYVLRQAQNMTVAQDTQARASQAQYYDNEVEYMLKELTSEENVGSAAAMFLKNIGMGSTHVIRPSDKFQDGYDILFTGMPGTCVSLRPGVQNHEIPEAKNHHQYRTMHAEGGHFTLEPAKKAMQYSRTLINAIFGESSATAATQSQRKVVLLPVDFNFKKLLAETSAKLNGLGIDPRKISDSCPTYPTTFPTLFKKYFSIVAVLDAPSNAVREKNNNPLVNGETTNIAEEALYMQPTISFSLAINLPKEFVSFITQTKPGGRIPMTSLNTWAIVWARGYLRKLKSKGTRGEGGGIALSQVPRYVLSASSTQELIERRKNLGFYTEEGRSNDDHLYVSNIGTLNYCPKASDLALDNARNYEKLMEDALQVSYSAGAPLSIHLVDEGNPVFGINSPEYRSKIRGFKDSIKKYAGSMQAYSWDYNCILTTAVGEPDKLNAIKLSGAAIPDELSLSDYMRKPFAKAMQLMFVSSKEHKGSERPTVTDVSFGAMSLDATPMLLTTPLIHTRQLYAYLLSEGTVPSLQELINRAAKDLNITNLEKDENVSKYEWGFNGNGNLHKGLLTADLHVAPTITPDQDAETQTDALYLMLSRALKDASGVPGSNLARVAVQEGTDITDDPRYFKSSEFTMAEFKNVYAYLGGRVFYHMLKSLTEVEKKKLMLVNPANALKLLPYSYIVEEVMPLAIMLSKYVPDSEAIFKVGDELAERNQKNDSITQDDIRVPGSKAPDPTTGKTGMQMFPHQIEGHKYLRNIPRFAVLDIAPGGGKTIEVLSDIACLVRDKHIQRPLIACPSGLVRNWVEDMHKITQGKWNVIPITSETIKTWGFEKLTEMIANAPRNTVCVVGYSAISRGNQFQIIIGNHVEKVSGTLEFIKKFPFDYVALDESHRVKNPDTSTHKTIKQLCTSSNVKFVRLATGTLISNKLTDVVGQAAMFNSQIFRTPKEYEAENSEMKDGISVWKKETPQLARAQLARHSAVITFKRKEWAFMLPLPQEEFIPVSMQKEPEEGGHQHQMMYDAVLDSTLDEIRAAMKDPNGDLAKLLKGGDEEGEENGNGDDEGAPVARKRPTDEAKIQAAVEGFFDKDGTVRNQGMDDSTLEELSKALGPYLQRLEMLLTDPLGDEFGEKYFAAVNRDNFVSNKVLKVIERIKLNFEERPWIQGGRYKKSDPNDSGDDDAVMPDVCDYQGNRYVLLPAQGSENDAKLYYQSYISNTPPDQDSRWKKETHGKVLVFCRYTRSVNAIFEALQKLEPGLAKAAVKFHGEIKNKWEGLDKFKATKIDITCKSGVQILIANEQAISEGHNLQMASRMIRVEAPWAPGELDQASARIFRPDPKGDFGREHIYLDWILTDNSLEVAKMGRLISKMLSKAQFDEANNPLYKEINDYQLPMKSMGIEALQEKETLADIEAYTTAYQHLAHIVGKEFRHMRQTKASKMFDIEPEEMFEDAKIIPFVPYVPNMTIPDRQGLGFTVMTEWLQDTKNPDVQNIMRDPMKLVGMYVHTEMGNGSIKRINFTRGDRRINSVIVTLDNGDEYAGDISMIHVSPLLTPEVSKKLPKAGRLTKGQKEQMEKEKIRAQKKSEKEDKRLKGRAVREITELERLKKIELLKNKVKAPKVGSAPKKPAKVVEEEENNNVEFFPMMFNGFLAIDAIVEDEDIALEGHGFNLIKDYAFLKVPDYANFTTVLKWLEAKFYIKKDTLARLHLLHDSFTSGRGRKFDVEQAPISEFKDFYAMYRKHTLSKGKDDTPNGKPELKVYPTVMNGSLFLNVDMATNPIIKRWVDKPIPGAKVHFEHAGSVWLKFARTIPALKAVVKELTDEGFVHTNKKEFDEELSRLKIIHAKHIK